MYVFFSSQCPGVRLKLKNNVQFVSSTVHRLKTVPILIPFKNCDTNFRIL